MGLLIRGLNKPEGTRKISVYFYLADGGIEGVHEIWSIETEEVDDIKYDAFKEFEKLLLNQIECKILYGKRKTNTEIPLVRCKDCIHRPRKEDPDEPGEGFNLVGPSEDDNICPCIVDDGWYSWMPPDDFYCARGEG